MDGREHEERLDGSLRRSGLAVDPRAWAAPPPAGIRRYVPIVRWLPEYRRADLPFDLIAGATIWGLLIPEMIAYAGLAGLPPQAGLYTLLASLAAYAIFGTSRHVVVAGTSAAAVLLASSVTGLAPKDFLRLRGPRDAAGDLLRGPVPGRGDGAIGVHRELPVATRDRGIRLRPRDLRDDQAAAQAARDRGRERRLGQAARARDPPPRRHQRADARSRGVRPRSALPG